MARLSEKLFDYKEVLKFFRIPVSCSDNKIFLNVSKNSIVKFYDEKPLHTWTLIHPHHFTSPVLYTEGYVYCVMDNNTVMKWPSDEDNIINAEKILFQETIFVTIPMKKRLLALSESGKYAIIDTAKFSHAKLLDFISLKEHEELVWADGFRKVEITEVFCIVCNKKSQENIVYCFTVNEESNTPSNLSIKNLFRENTSLLSWSLNHHDSTFLSVWSDGTVFSHNVKDSVDIKLLSFENIKKDNVMAIEAVDSTHIAVARSLEQKDCLLEIWDTKCGVLKAKKILKTNNLSYIQMAVANSKIFLAYNQELVSIAFEIENPTFSAAVGKSQSKSKAIEYSWGTKTELLQESTPDESEAMEICDQEYRNKNGDSLDVIAQKLLEENSDYVTYIEEAELVKLLQFAIRLKTKETDDDSTKQKTNTLLNIILSASFNDVFLVKFLKMLNSEDAFMTIELLLSYLEKTIKLEPNTTNRPSDLQIVNWAFLIIQSHVQDLLLSKDIKSRKLLKQFKKALSIKMEEYENYSCIQNYFSIIEKKNLLPQQCSIGKYSVESLDF